MQVSEWHIAIVLLCKEYFEYVYGLEENILVV